MIVSIAFGPTRMIQTMLSKMMCIRFKNIGAVLGR